MPKTMRVPMTDEIGNVVFWVVGRVKTLGDGTRWMFTDHNGYERDGGKTWPELRSRFSSCAENHSLTHRLS